MKVSYRRGTGFIGSNIERGQVSRCKSAVRGSWRKEEKERGGGDGRARMNK